MSSNEINGYLDAITSRLSRSEPIERVPGNTAAVAVIFKKDGSLLLIKRVERSGDPWSGNVAFPGGHVEAGDSSFSDAASREAKEEVGLNVRNGHFIGYMESFEPRNRKVSVVPCVFLLLQEEPIIPNQEVSSYQWVPLKSISSANRYSYIYEQEKQLVLPAFKFGNYVVWGLTERILTKLVELTGTIA